MNSVNQQDRTIIDGHLKQHYDAHNAIRTTVQYSQIQERISDGRQLDVKPVYQHGTKQHFPSFVRNCFSKEKKTSEQTVSEINKTFLNRETDDCGQDISIYQLKECIFEQLEKLVQTLYYSKKVPYEVSLEYLKLVNKQVEEIVQDQKKTENLKTQSGGFGLSQTTKITNSHNTIVSETASNDNSNLLTSKEDGEFYYSTNSETNTDASEILEATIWKADIISSTPSQSEVESISDLLTKIVVRKSEIELENHADETDVLAELKLLNEVEILLKEVDKRGSPLAEILKCLKKFNEELEKDALLLNESFEKTSNAEERRRNNFISTTLIVEPCDNVGDNSELTTDITLNSHASHSLCTEPDIIFTSPEIQLCRSAVDWIDADRDSFTAAIKGKNYQQIKELLQRSDIGHEEVISWMFYIFSEETVDETLLETILSWQELPINARNSSGETVLHVLAKNGHRKLAQIVLDRYKIVDSECQKGNTPLLLAADNGHLEVMKVLADNGANLKKANEVKNTALHLTACGGHLNCVRFLIEEAGFDVDPVNDYGDTPLLKAAGRGHTQCCAYLLEKGADLYHYENNRQSSLMESVFGRDTQCVKLMLSHVSEDQMESFVNLSTIKNKKTALHLAVYQQNVELTKLLLENKANPDAQMSNGITALMWAVSNHYYDIVSLLLEAGANVNIKGSYSHTALSWAIQRGDTQIVEKLLDSKYGAKIGLRHDGETYLMAACRRGHIEIVRLLLQAGADPTVTNKHSKTAADLTENQKILQLLSKY